MTANEWANQDWVQNQEWERQWWGDCENSYAEEVKQLTYANRMGLQAYTGPGKWPCYDMEGRRILDIGGGPVSILLKCYNRGQSRVVDPCEYPDWVQSRYWKSGIEYVRARGEDLNWGPLWWDEVWIYNVLQHTEDPELIIKKAKIMAPTIRIFEWIDIPPHKGHPQELKEETLNEWLEGKGTTEWPTEPGCNAHAYYGVFHYPR